MLTTRFGLVKHTAPVTGGGDGVSGSGNVTSGSGLVQSLTLPTPAPAPPAPPAPPPARSSSSIELRRRPKFIGLDKFFISEILDLSSDRSDFIDDAFISLEDVMWCTLCEDDDVDEEQEDLATRELEVEAVLLACSI
jgi:hypothetical protein